MKSGAEGTLGKQLEFLPSAVVASLEVRDAWRSQVASGSEGLEFIVSDLARWRPGSSVRVAFLDGDADLHADIEQATQQITEACNLRLDFGQDKSTGQYRRWTDTDTGYAAEIRVSFDCDGYWSLVGTDSTDRTVGAAGDPEGGRPGQRSLNLGGFTESRPADWQGIVRHEFLHALAFHHAHQNMRGPCEEEFRWADDPGYVPTRDEYDAFVADHAGRRPGIYTYLAGAPNYWPSWKVDYNLRKEDSPDIIVGPFDSESIMLYRFESIFYRTWPSKCAPTGDGLNLSDGDRRGLRLLYPETAVEVCTFTTRAEQALGQIGADPAAGLESTGSIGSLYQARVIELLNSLVNDGG